jgi:hypothetical protein
MKCSLFESFFQISERRNLKAVLLICNQAYMNDTVNPGIDTPENAVVHVSPA